MVDFTHVDAGPRADVRAVREISRGRPDRPNPAHGSSRTLSPERSNAILVHPIFPRGVRALSKRKPPSKRPERKMDETAKAIARVRDEAKPEKPPETGEYPSENKARSGSLGKTNTVQKQASQVSRRQKTG